MCCDNKMESNTAENVPSRALCKRHPTRTATIYICIQPTNLGWIRCSPKEERIDRIKTSVNRSALKKNIYMYLSKESVHEWLSLWTKYHMTTRLTLCYTVHFVLFLLNTIWTSVHLNLQRTNGSILKIILEGTNTDKSKRSAVFTKLTVLLKC